ncbi:hypothetical protein [Mycoplasmopsis fermentans]|uniref:hypothetical protein n=1 Tax=Mycoplasmopsis fermentans TaxID=2115 RepID=UPI0001E32E87|nr:hypothetical protein [Mycoplasmopsis fermentans]ADN69058.1 hypothetical membrane spanning protein [Mycoplasmopsis fermentans JER]
MIWNILTFVLAIITFVFYSLYKTIKKFLIKKSFDAVSEVYRMYSSATSTDNSFLYISATFIDQKLFFCSFSDTILDLTKKNDELDPFSFYDYSLWEKQWFFNIIYFYKFWKVVKNKMLEILKILNNYDYIAQICDFKLYEYRNKNNNPIKQFIIVFCPTFYTELFQKNQNFKSRIENKFDLIDKYNESKKFRKKFYKELKSDLFSICIEFFLEKEVQNLHKYVINFKGNKISDVYCFFEKNDSENDFLYKKELWENEVKIESEIKWIEKSFNLDLKNKCEIVSKMIDEKREFFEREKENKKTMEWYRQMGVLD